MGMGLVPSFSDASYVRHDDCANRCMAAWQNRRVRPVQHRVLVKWHSQSGQSLLETALTLPLILLIAVGILEFGRAFQTWQVVTNAAREGARVAILPNATTDDVQSRVMTYLQGGALDNYQNATVTVNQNTPVAVGAGTAATSVVTVAYPFSFLVMNPVANLVVNGSTVGTPLTVTAAAEMRNEVQ
jgi:Flp pilus assembly protein TadG